MLERLKALGAATRSPEGHFSSDERRLIDIAIRAAEVARRLEFSVYVGPLDPPCRARAEILHSVMAAPDRSVLVALDPEARSLEIVTGPFARGILEDAYIASVADAMVEVVDRAGLTVGIVEGLALLARTADPDRATAVTSARARASVQPETARTRSEAVR